MEQEMSVRLPVCTWRSMRANDRARRALLCQDGSVDGKCRPSPPPGRPRSGPEPRGN